MSSKNLKYEESEYIDYDIPSDDMDSYIRMYHSKAVKVRKDCRCRYCGYPISKGEYALAFSVFVDGEPCYGHYCMGCVEDNMSMEKGEIDDKELLCRYARRLESSDNICPADDDDHSYEMQSDMRDYCERYEPTYNPEDGSM